MKTQHQIPHGKNVRDLRLIQAKCVQTGIEKHLVETSKLIDMSSSAFAEALNGSKKS